MTKIPEKASHGVVVTEFQRIGQPSARQRMAVAELINERGYDINEDAYQSDAGEFFADVPSHRHPKQRTDIEKTHLVGIVGANGTKKEFSFDETSYEIETTQLEAVLTVPEMRRILQKTHADCAYVSDDPNVRCSHITHADGYLNLSRDGDTWVVRMPETDSLFVLEHMAPFFDEYKRRRSLESEDPKSQERKARVS